MDWIGCHKPSTIPSAALTFLRARSERSAHLPPGDYIDTYVTALLEGSVSLSGGGATDGAFSETVARTLRAQHGLDKPIHIQYAQWAWNMVRLDFGQSLEFQKPVVELVTERLMMTIILADTTAIFAWCISIPIGIYSAVRSTASRTTRSLSWA